jgi:hypothetical protein
MKTKKDSGKSATEGDTMNSTKTTKSMKDRGKVRDLEGRDVERVNGGALSVRKSGGDPGGV